MRPERVCNVGRRMQGGGLAMGGACALVSVVSGVSVSLLVGISSGAFWITTVLFDIRSLDSINAD